MLVRRSPSILNSSHRPSANPNPLRRAFESLGGAPGGGVVGVSARNDQAQLTGTSCLPSYNTTDLDKCALPRDAGFFCFVPCCNFWLVTALTCTVKKVEQCYDLVCSSLAYHENVPS